ncbi:hypothetical protein [Nocardioides sp.]|uniref:Vgb family protein n=1 Tax=Nocardioides sp. TaxID=35761 RepID=UPI0039E431AD
MLISLRRTAVLVPALALLASAASVSIAPATHAAITGNFGSPLAIETWAVPSGDSGLIEATQGPDFGQGGIVSWNGAVWFAEENAGKIGRIDTAGTITEYDVPDGAGAPGYGPRQLTAATSGQLWFLADGGALDGRAAWMDPAGVTQALFNFPGYVEFSSLAATPDGGAWLSYGDGEDITRLDATAEETAFFDEPEYYADVESTLGPDGALWYSDGSNRIERITESGSLTTYPATGDNGEIVSMTTSGGNIWYAQFSPGSLFVRSYDGIVAKMSTSGIPTPFPSPYPDLLPAGLTPASDGGVWFTTHHGAGIGHVSPAGQYQVALLPDGYAADSVTQGPDGNLWFTDADLNRIGRVTIAAFNAAIASQGGGAGLTIAPKAKVKAGKAVLRATCTTTTACTGKLAAKLKKKTLAKGKYAVGAGATKKVKLRLTKAGRAYFRAHRKAKVVVAGQRIVLRR